MYVHKQYMYVEEKWYNLVVNGEEEIESLLIV